MAFVLIFLAVLIYALYPSAVLHFVSEQVDVFSFLIVFHLVASTVSISIAAYYQQRVLVLKNSLPIDVLDHRIINKRTINIGIVNTIFDILGRGSFFFALYYGSAVQATVFYELWASVFLLMTMLLRNNQPGQFDHHQGKINTAIFFVLGVIGLVLVVSSHETATDTTREIFSGNFDAIVLLAAIASPFLMAASFFVGTKNARIISSNLKSDLLNSQHDGQSLTSRRIDFLAGNYHGLFPRVFGIFILVMVGAVLYLLDIWSPDIQLISIWAVLGVVLCALMTAAGGTLADISNNLSKNSNLNNFWNFTPFLAVIFLNFFGFSNDASKELYFGAILILAANYVLLSKSTYSVSFLASIFSLCAIYFAILFIPPVRETQGLQHVAVPLGIFGIFAALFLDRIVRCQDLSNKTNPNLTSKMQSSLFGEGLYSHYVFILWILGLGSILSMILFRPDSRIDIEFVSAFLAVAVVYICLLPLEFMMLDPAKKKVDTQKNSTAPQEIVLSLVTSALFISGLFILYLFALLQDATLNI